MNTAKLIYTDCQKLFSEISQIGSILKVESIRKLLPFLTLKLAINVVHKAQHIVNIQHMALKF